MPGRERVLFGEPKNYICCIEVDITTLVTVDVPVLTLERAVLLDEVAFKIEPAAAGPSIGTYNRMIAWAFTDDNTDPIDFQFQMSRDGTNFVNVGPEFEAVNVTGAQIYINSPNPRVIDSPFPPDFMTDPTEATDIDDELTFRSSFTQRSGTPGTTRVGYVVMFVPSITASQSKPMRGNVFSGAQY